MSLGERLYRLQHPRPEDIRPAKDVGPTRPCLGHFLRYLADSGPWPVVPNEDQRPLGARLQQLARGGEPDDV
jgi:hypothetical protein